MPKYLYAQNLTEEELLEIKSFKKQGSNEFVRGRIIELSSAGKRPKDISNSVVLSVVIVREWIRRFNKERLPGLLAKKSPGRPRKFPEEIRYQVRAIISDAPSEYGIPKIRWTLSDMCRITVELGLVDSISKEQVRRLFVEVGWTYTRAKKWQRSPDQHYRRRRNRQRRLEKWASEDDTIAFLYWDQFWRNILHLPSSLPLVGGTTMSGSYSPKGDFLPVPPNERVSLSVTGYEDARDISSLYAILP